MESEEPRFKKLELYYRVTDATVEEIAALQAGEQPAAIDQAETPVAPLPEREQDLLNGMMSRLAEANLPWMTPRIYRRFESLLQHGKIDRDWMVKLVGGHMDHFRNGVKFIMEDE